MAETKREKEMAEAIERLEAEERARATEGIEETRRYAKPRRPTSPSQVYSVRVPADRLEELRRVAAKRGLQPSTLLRKWVIERLDEERVTSERSVVVYKRGVLLATTASDASAAAAFVSQRIDDVLATNRPLSG
jgi:hypothetical protein